MFSDTWAQQNTSGSGSEKSPNSRGGAERWFSSGPLVIIGRGREGRQWPGRLCPHLFWLELRNSSCCKLRWEAGLGYGGGQLEKGQTLWFGVTVPLFRVTVPSLGSQVRHLVALPCPGLSTWCRLWMGKGLHVDVLANKTCGSEGQHTNCASRPLPWEGFYSYSSNV